MKQELPLNLAAIKSFFELLKLLFFSFPVSEWVSVYACSFIPSHFVVNWIRNNSTNYGARYTFFSLFFLLLHIPPAAVSLNMWLLPFCSDNICASYFGWPPPYFAYKCIQKKKESIDSLALTLFGWHSNNATHKSMREHTANKNIHIRNTGEPES